MSKKNFVFSEVARRMKSWSTISEVPEMFGPRLKIGRVLKVRWIGKQTIQKTVEVTIWEKNGECDINLFKRNGVRKKMWESFP